MQINLQMLNLLKCTDPVGVNSIEVQTEPKALRDSSNQTHTYKTMDGSQMSKLPRENVNPPTSKNLGTQKRKPITKYFCSICEKYFAWKFTLDRHVKAKHMEVPKGLNQEERKGKKAKKLPLPPLNLERKGHERKANSELPSPSRKSVRLH